MCIFAAAYTHSCPARASRSGPLDEPLPALAQSRRGRQTSKRFENHRFPEMQDLVPGAGAAELMSRNKSADTQRDMLSAAGYEALAAFRYRLRRYLAFTEEVARSVGLTSQQHQALLAIRARSFSAPMTSGDLAAEMMVRHHSAVELVGRLEKAGLTTRTNDPDDRRKVLVSLTAKGERVLARLSARNLKELRAIGPDLPELLDQLRAGAPPRRPR